jgi:hypothetical protein
MRSNQSILKGISLLLIILLMQKSGLGLYLHDWLHAQNQNFPSQKHLAVIDKGATCSCIDDFNMPLAETPASVTGLIPEIKRSFLSILEFPIPFSSRYYSSLRGPPTNLA